MRDLRRSRPTRKFVRVRECLACCFTSAAAFHKNYSSTVVTVCGTLYRVVVPTIHRHTGACGHTVEKGEGLAVKESENPICHKKIYMCVINNPHCIPALLTTWQMVVCVSLLARRPSTYQLALLLFFAASFARSRIKSAAPGPRHTKGKSFLVVS